MDRVLVWRLIPSSGHIYVEVSGKLLFQTALCNKTLCYAIILHDWGYSRVDLQAPPDHDSTFYVTETPALTTQPCNAAIHMSV